MKRVVRGALVVVLLFFGFVVWWCIGMPGRSYTGELPPLADQELARDLEGHVRYLSETLGERHGHTFKAQRGEPAELEAAADYIHKSLAPLPVERQVYAAESREFCNVIAERKGAEPILVVGAHYDTCPPTPGADDNASGVAILLELARRYQGNGKTVRFVAFTNEEPYHFQTESMGSLVYARACRAKNEPIEAMLSLETLGYYKDEEGTQRYPFPLGLAYPGRGNFVAFVGNLGSRPLVHRTLGTFRREASFPSEGACLPEGLPGIGWSDHWSFWQAGYPAIMVTDTAPFRNPNYHQETDTPDTLDYNRMARVTLGLQKVLEELAR